MNRKKMTLFNYVNGVFLLLLVIVCILPMEHPKRTPVHQRGYRSIL